jgi:hypothetical protein
MRVITPIRQVSALEVDAAGNVAWWADNKGAHLFDSISLNELL